MTFRLIKTKNTNKNIITSIIGISSMCALFFFGSFQLRMTLPPKSEAANIGGVCLPFVTLV